MPHYTKEEIQEIDRNLPALSEYNYLYSDKAHAPRHVTVESSGVSLASFMDGETPAVIEESKRKRAKARSRREAAIKAEKIIKLDDTPREAVITAGRALLLHGYEVADEQGVPKEFVDSAEVQLNEALGPEGGNIVDAPSLALGALALERMANDAEEKDIERRAAALALGEFPRDQEVIDLLKREQIGHDSGELAVQAILEHEPISA